MTFNKKLGAAVAVATFVATVLAPLSVADTTLNISDNGNSSTNTITTNDAGNSTITQSNGSLIFSFVNTTSNSGNNTASSNTGGDVNLTTGGVNTTVTSVVTGSSNTLTDPSCGCTGNLTVNIYKNGNNSKSTVKVGTKSTSLKQTNKSAIVAGTKTDSNSGNNMATKNTHGSIIVTSGSITSNVTAVVGGSSNTITP